jgi:hypothetical protein
MDYPAIDAQARPSTGSDQDLCDAGWRAMCEAK